MIIAVCSDKGSPGVTTLAVALAMTWPGRRIVLECDPAGADLPFRLRGAASGEMISPEPSVAAVAAAARLDTDPDDLHTLAQPTTLGVAAIPGMLTPERAAVLRGLWPAIASLTARCDATVIADLGRMQPGSPVMPVAQSATAVVLVTRYSTEGLFRLRERVGVLGANLATPDSGPRLSVVLSGAEDRHREALRDGRELLESIGSPARVAGFLPLAATDLDTLWSGTPTRRLLRGPLLKSARRIAQELLAFSPALAGTPAVTVTTAIGGPQ